LFICDDAAKITLIEMGWPCSKQENQVQSNSHVHFSMNKYFDNKEYLLGVLAFSASSVMDPAFFKRPQFQT